MDAKEIVSFVGIFITGICLGAWLSAIYIVYRMAKYHAFRWDKQIFTVNVHRSTEKDK